MTMAALLPEPPPVAFTYALPAEPVAGAAVDIGHVTVTIGLLLTGDLEVLAGPGPVDAGRTADTGRTADVGRIADAGRTAALAALGTVAKGVMIRGLGSATPSVTAAGHRFTQRHHDFRAPNTVISAGDCAIDITGRHDGVAVTVSGQVDYALEVTAERPPSATAPRGWFRRHEKELASIGLVLLVATPIAPVRLVVKEE
jgi:hypothetical protein